MYKSVGAEGDILFMVRALEFHSFIAPYSQTFMFTASVLFCPGQTACAHLETFLAGSCWEVKGPLTALALLKKLLSSDSSSFSLAGSVVERTRKVGKSSLALTLSKVADGSEKPP